MDTAGLAAGARRRRGNYRHNVDNGAMPLPTKNALNLLHLMALFRLSAGYRPKDFEV
jgi:hypothetical protein